MKVGAHPGRTLSPDLRSLSFSSEANLSYGSSSVFQEQRNTDINLESPGKAQQEPSLQTWGRLQCLCGKAKLTITANSLQRKYQVVLKLISLSCQTLGGLSPRSSGGRRRRRRLTLRNASFIPISQNKLLRSADPQKRSFHRGVGFPPVLKSCSEPLRVCCY